MDERHFRKYSTSIAIREMQIETTLRFHITHISMAKVKSTDNDLHWRGCEVKGTKTSPLLVGVQSGITASDNVMVISQIIRKQPISSPI